jgi:hypothetical protein
MTDREELTRLRLENGRLREQLRRNDLHLRARTAALVRLIARQGPAADPGYWRDMIG